VLEHSLGGLRVSERCQCDCLESGTLFVCENASHKAVRLNEFLEENSWVGRGLHFSIPAKTISAAAVLVVVVRSKHNRAIIWWWLTTYVTFWRWRFKHSSTAHFLHSSSVLAGIWSYWERYSCRLWDAILNVVLSIFAKNITDSTDIKRKIYSRVFL
jgi:hypothetical protein